MRWLLTLRELITLQEYREPDNDSLGYETNIAIHQDLKTRQGIYEWGNEECLHNAYSYTDKRGERHNILKKRECSLCWQELIKD